MEVAAESMATYTAEFLDGWSLQPQRVEVSFDAAGMRIARVDGPPLTHWSAAGLRCDAMQEGVLHVTHSDSLHETLVVHDPNLEARLLSIAPTQARLPGGKRKLAFALACLGALAALGGGLYWSTPRIARAVARRIPLEQERALGGQIEPLLRVSRCPDGAARIPLQRLITRLGGQGQEVQLIRESTPNAFALPGGIILVTHGLLREAGDPGEVAGVLAHEIEHVAQRHVLAGFIRDAVLAGIWSLTVGDYAGLLVIDPSTAYRIANLEFSREDEASADTGAIARLHRLGYSHLGLARFFERLEKRYGKREGPEWMSTHPNTRARLDRLRATTDVEAPLAPLSPEEAALLKRGCDP